TMMSVFCEFMMVCSIPRGDEREQSSHSKNRSAVTPRRRLWIRTLAHVARILLRGAEDRFAKLRVLFHERRHECIKESEHVVTDQHLTVAVRSCPNTDRGNPQPGSDRLGDGIRNRFEYDRKGPGVFECKGVEHQFLGGLVIARLLAHSSEAM